MKTDNTTRLADTEDPYIPSVKALLWIVKKKYLSQKQTFSRQLVAILIIIWKLKI